MSNKIPLSLYVHIPWCVKKCPYCDFNSHEKNQSFNESRYVKALLIDLDEEFKYCQQRSLSSIFFGGGTPSLFSADAINKIIEHAKSLFKFENIEITLEANPGTFEQDKFTAYRNAGVNRLSIGIQSFNASHLKILGRIHDNQQALSAVATAKKAGFTNINLDLMFGLPQQSIQQAIEDVKIACQFDVPHISHYQLTIEENTYFHKHTPTLPEIDLIWEMQSQCQNILAKNNFHQYEISAYSQSERQCQHNINYWQFSDYIGIGAGAHGKLTNINASDGSMDIIRRWKHRQPQQYIEKTIIGNSLSGNQTLSQQDIVFEFLLNALRLKSGSDIQNFKNSTGLKYSTLVNAVKNIDTELLLIDEKSVRTTDKGFLFLNTILEELV
ncbi:MAG: YggW family oxidoreductase [Thiotrichaceae bacterium]|nr:MAG: YggW family oxidoreductase [Thiotrichaceae bacterium]